MTAPATIAAILRGPCLCELVAYPDEPMFVMDEPLRFVPIGYSGTALLPGRERAATCISPPAHIPPIAPTNTATNSK